MPNSWTGNTLSGRYQVEDLVGHGGMSSVYRATDSNLKRVVAVKLIHPHLTGDAEFLRRFETEAESVAQLRHSNIIQVFDFNHEDGYYYMVMEFVAGESLQQRLQRLSDAGRRLSTDEVVKIATSVCDAMAYAHKKGMVHRDVKPANIMLSVQGDAILTDFGLARIAGTTQHTAAGAVLGTALYMSPEQIRGEQVDHRTDIYAMGVTLFEMLGGRPPFTADSAMTVLMMHLNDPLPDLRELNPDVPPALAAVVEKALAKDPAGRYTSAEEMAAALREAQDAQAAPAVPPPDATMVAGAGAAAAAAPPPPPPPDATAAHSPDPIPAVGAGSTPPPSSPPPAAEDAGGAGIPPWAFAIAGVGLVSLVGMALLAAGVFGGSDDLGEGIVVGTSTSTPAPTPTEGAADPTDVEPTEAAPTPTPLPDLYAQINDISLAGQTYVVEYETFGYTETLPGMHVHFYFDTVPESEAGVPGDGPWALWGGPRPFTEYEIIHRPEGATEMCARVAYEDHSIIFDSGNCYPLPDA